MKNWCVVTKTKNSEDAKMYSSFVTKVPNDDRMNSSKQRTDVNTLECCVLTVYFVCIET